MTIINAGGATGSSETIQVDSLPVASVTELGNIYQYVGATDQNYTNGYFYKCVSDGQTPATYSWEQTNVQPTPSGLPDQTGNSGKFLTTDGTDASWATISALQNTATGGSSLTILGAAANGMWNVNIGDGSSCGSNLMQNTAIGHNAKIESEKCVAVGQYAKISYNSSSSVAVGRLTNISFNSTNAIALGAEAEVTANRAIQIGSGTNSDANTLKVSNENGNFEIMNANGNLPADRLASTSGLADGNYRLRLTMASGVPTLSWVAE